ncbi:methylenetetrahydrofolate reductase [NAD(P)H] [Pelagicoccus sp. SDUM812003]|uniref:methylenetetrahydrofolate reductase [NAD(P)H] n=1 Tax=Pelagicoccus sp. SDUM812003 TaxID=3041267 RepID=UPI00280FD392|nr:methylenetetrahydrofolate reductase [NAD(P)H] [Pelagicoccus sp. SDUM812003]MDQ8202005.1 methylenetetrahydrofolate reductase [NAD(P)H] [Pelagicoccus sp. SDUM812003]
MIAQQRIDDLLATKGQLLSVEFFPPKSEEAIDSLVSSSLELKALEPDFVSVTYGAGGSTRDRSSRVSAQMRDDLGFNVMPHLTCVGASKDELGEIIDGFYAEGYRNIMALRGDPPKDQTEFVVAEGGFAFATDLVSFISERYPDICIGVAGYPEKHPEASSMEKDLEHLKVKVDAGASFITTQLFFDNQRFYDFVEKAQKQGVSLPIFPGLMPVLATKQIKRIVSMCGSSLPDALDRELEKAGEDAEAVKEIGTNWALNQLEDLAKNGVPGVHLYALNRSDAAKTLMSAFRSKQSC